MILLIDFDGVIGSQRKYLAPDGSRAFLEVSSRDSMAMRRMVAAGIRVIIVTSSNSSLIKNYALRHMVELIATDDKLGSLEELGIDVTEAIAIGDDVSDIPFMQKAATAYCPADAHPEVKKWFPSLESNGGGGCISELETLCHDKIYRTGPTVHDNGAVIR